MAKLTSHVLDTASGKPAAGMRIDLLRGHFGSAVLVKTIRTNTDGRSDAPLIEGPEFHAGHYTVLFHVAEYYRAASHPDAGKFLDAVPVQIVVGEPVGNYHVPLLVSPWAYSTYRGS